MSQLCYNRGCGQRFDPSANTEDSCTYHPGVPVFHDALKLNIHIIFEGDKEFDRNVKLWGVIDVKRSYVNMTATKIELTMRKAEPMLWASLELPIPKTQQKQNEDITDQE
ncbi:hypothetical protein KIL84_018182 [Mauremys mutica]|uniref:CHORD domain-containing protein n=1 Tax=Mauremys mutica TaxID=74926 RepID=A0A9D3XSR2_9SAUR|nr:hypothetical protein KIL84_018182 [Mauremys mutica]